MLIEDEQFISVKELAKILDTHTSVIYKYIRTGKLYSDLYIRFGKKILFRASRLDKYLFPKEVTEMEQMQNLMLQSLKNYSSRPSKDFF